MHVLVAEDERITRAALVRQLQAWGHTVIEAEDGEAAWQRFSERPFDIVLTDWEMPHLSGLELVERIRAQPGARFVYLIMLTGRTEKADLVRGIEAGADDFVSKPFDREELRVRLLAGGRIVHLERTLESRNRVLHETSERMKRDLHAAARVQAAMLPSHNVVTQSVRTAWKYVPTDELAGDGIGLHLLQDRYLYAYVLDVSGHGVPAALLSVSMMHALSPEPIGTSLLRDPGSSTGIRAPELVADELNRRFPFDKNDGRFATLILCLMDTHTGDVNIVRAGHPPPILLRGTTSMDVPDVAGLPLCIAEDVPYEACSIRLQAGDRLCLISDGFLEQPQGRPDRERKLDQFGCERVTLALSSQHGSTIDRAADHTIEALAAWAGENKFIDDVSLVIIEGLGADG